MPRNPLNTVVKRGRPKEKDALVFKTIGLSEERWTWLAKWHPSTNPTRQITELVERSMKFWPAGPERFR